MANPEKDFFLKNVTVILSPQEKSDKIYHITNKFDMWGVQWKKLYAPYHLKQGDYTFQIQGKDYREEFLIERKFGVEELYACLTDKNIETKAKTELCEERLRDNLEYEFARMKQIGVKEKWLFIENCRSFESIKFWMSGYERKNCTHGSIIYSTLSSWACGNRYDFKIECIPKNDFIPSNIPLPHSLILFNNQSLSPFIPSQIPLTSSEPISAIFEK